VFIPIAEESGLIDELGAWTLREACRAACEWPDIHVAVNVSPAQFRNPNFDVLLSTILTETRLPSRALELEITETYLIENPAQARRSINAIRNLGVSVALDDFGTGFSSVGYLRSFTFDKLKLDRSLIVGIATDQRAQRFVQATIALADSLDLDVCAEGVESEEEALLLRIAGCREFQGFFFARPCSAAEFTALVQDRDSAASSTASA
jgi:EAL domain-containing protein (putative c-di-GMP-specific phosphodiesterase class I)